jgi:hypothetical protein
LILQEILVAIKCFQEFLEFFFFLVHFFGNNPIFKA